jgi:hypothetical protein
LPVLGNPAAEERPMCPTPCFRLSAAVLLVVGRSLQAAPSATVIDSCVSPARMSFQTGVSGVMLDDIDREPVAAAIVERYPVIEHDGLYPTAIALWRRPDGPWLYAVLAQKAHAPHAPCFTAHVLAQKVVQTPGLLKKYFGVAP